MSETETLPEPQIDVSAAVPSACERLARVLENYEKAATELEEFRGCITLAENDENSALEDDTITEAEVVQRVKDAQALRAVYAARAARRERELITLGADLEQTCRLGEREVLERIEKENSKRRLAVRTRVLEVLDIEGDPDFLIRQELNLCVHYAKFVRAIADIRPNCYFENISSTVNSARAVLECQRRFEAETAQPE